MREATMRLLRQGAAAALALAMLFGAAPAAHGGTGTFVITSDTTLGEDHQGDIVIAADGVTLDCAGFTTSGATSVPSGIDLSGRRWVTVVNCNLHGFAVGLRLVNANENNLVQNTVSGAAVDACQLDHAHLNVVTDSAFDGNGGGCALVDSTFNIFERNSLSANIDEGFDLDRASDNNFTGNDVSSNHDGFDLGDSHRNGIRENAVGWTNFNGIELDGSNSNTIEDNQTFFNGTPQFRNGISLNGSTGNVLRRNVSNFNARDGFRIDASSGNLFEANSACNNGEIDAFQRGSTNVFDGNNFCTKSPTIP
jgi:parallel beta-helix repeat protein